MYVCMYMYMNIYYKSTSGAIKKASKTQFHKAITQVLSIIFRPAQFKYSLDLCFLVRRHRYVI